MFATINDTNKWAVAIDGYYQLFDSKNDADNFYESSIPEYIEDSCFGSAMILPPQYIPKFIDGTIPTCRLSDCHPINLVDYVSKSQERKCKYEDFQSLDKRLQVFKFKKYLKANPNATFLDFLIEFLEEENEPE